MEALERILSNEDLQTGFGFRYMDKNIPERRELLRITLLRFMLDRSPECAAVEVCKSLGLIRGGFLTQKGAEYCWESNRKKADPVKVKPIQLDFKI